MNNKATQNKTQQNVFKKYKYAIIAVTIIALVLFDFSPFGGNIRFYKKWIECGQKPVATKGSGYMNVGAKHYIEPSSWPGMHSTIEYFCTPLESEQAGYSARPDQYDFPHLRKERGLEKGQ